VPLLTLRFVLGISHPNFARPLDSYGFFSGELVSQRRFFVRDFTDEFGQPVQALLQWLVDTYNIPMTWQQVWKKLLAIGHEKYTMQNKPFWVSELRRPIAHWHRVLGELRGGPTRTIRDWPWWPAAGQCCCRTSLTTASFLLSPLMPAPVCARFVGAQ
jgi:hypothetical protein